MRHYEKICEYIDSISIDKVVYKHSAYLENRYYMKDVELPIRDIVGTQELDSIILEKCRLNTSFVEIGSPVTIVKKPCLRSIGIHILDEMRKFIRVNSSLPIVKIKALRRSQLSYKEENIEAIINYGIEILYFSTLDNKTKEALILKVFEKYTEAA